MVNIAKEHGHGVVGDNVHDSSTAAIERYDARKLRDRRVVLVEDLVAGHNHHALVVRLDRLVLGLNPLLILYVSRDVEILDLSVDIRLKVPFG